MSTTEKERPAPNEAQHEFAHTPHPDLWPEEVGGTVVFDKEKEEFVEADAVDERGYRDDRSFSGHEQLGKIHASADPEKKNLFSAMTDERKAALEQLAEGKTPVQVQAQAQLDAIEEQEKQEKAAEKAPAPKTAKPSSSSSN